MAGEWRKMTLGDAIELKRGYDLPNRDRRHGPFPIVSSSGISGCHNEAKAKAPGVVIGRYGTLGEVYYITEDYWPLNTALYVRDFKGNDPRFVSYFLRSLDFTAYSDKAAVPGLNRNDLHTAQVLLPSLSEQRAIAHILGTLDDKIELNRRMNETLEAMARALFKSWFVDFDPVRAKAGGRDPGLPDEIAKLFPDALTEHPELGEIPDGWEVRPLPEVVAVNPTRSLRKGEVAHFLKPDQVGWGSTEYIVLRALPPWPPEFAYCLARSTAFRDFAIQSMTRSSGRQRVPADSLSHFRLVVAPMPVAELFGSLVQPAFARASAAARESRTLAALRDALLPKLISGEPRVKDAERFLKERGL